MNDRYLNEEIYCMWTIVIWSYGLFYDCHQPLSIKFKVQQWVGLLGNIKIRGCTFVSINVDELIHGESGGSDYFVFHFFPCQSWFMGKCHYFPGNISYWHPKSIINLILVYLDYFRLVKVSNNIIDCRHFSSVQKLNFIIRINFIMDEQSYFFFGLTCSTSLCSLVFIFASLGET